MVSQTIRLSTYRASEIAGQRTTPLTTQTIILLAHFIITRECNTTNCQPKQSLKDVLVNDHGRVVNNHHSSYERQPSRLNTAKKKKRTQLQRPER